MIKSEKSKNFTCVMTHTVQTADVYLIHILLRFKGFRSHKLIKIFIFSFLVYLFFFMGKPIEKILSFI